MAEFFSGGMMLAPQIQRFYIDTTDGISFTRDTQQLGPDYGPTQVIPMRKESDSVIAGDENFYTIANRRVTVSQAGTYRITGQFWCDPQLSELDINGEVTEERELILEWTEAWGGTLLYMGFGQGLAAYPGPKMSGGKLSGTPAPFGTIHHVTRIGANRPILLQGQIYVGRINTRLRTARLTVNLVNNTVAAKSHLTVERLTL